MAMNERIRELIKQATNPDYDSDDGPMNELNVEKFAELIVRECSKVNNQYLGWRIGDIDLDLVYKEHFGVKE